MSADVPVSVAVLAFAVLLSETARRLLNRVLAHSGVSVHAAELVSTFQLCCCTHELRLLSEVGGVSSRLALTFTYIVSVVHALTFRGASGNPCGTLEHAFRARLSGASVLSRITCQFAAAAGARVVMRQVWSVGVSDLHARHAQQGFLCVSAVQAPLHEAAAVELVCTLVVQTVIARTREVEEKYRVHAVAATITTVVYTGGAVSGALFNPAVAFSTQLTCRGRCFTQHCLVYLGGPLLGTLISVLLQDRLLPAVKETPLSVHQRSQRNKET